MLEIFQYKFMFSWSLSLSVSVNNTILKPDSHSIRSKDPLYCKFKSLVRILCLFLQPFLHFAYSYLKIKEKKSLEDSFLLSYLFSFSFRSIGFFHLRNKECRWKWYEIFCNFPEKISSISLTYHFLKAIGCQWVSVCVCLFPNSSKTTKPDKLEIWGMIPLGMQKVLG